MLALTALAFPELSPYVFTLPIPEFEFLGIGFGPVPIRWYAMSYIVGLFAGFWYIGQLIKRPALYGGIAPPVTQEDIDDAFVWALIGIILGGRVGYVLFYQVPFEPDVLVNDPFSIIRVWDGGLAFHGGFIGVSLVIFLLARARNIPLLNFADLGAMLAPIPIFTVRVLGNFINAELYGRHTESSLGMIFPEGIAPNASGPPAAWDPVEKMWVYAGTELPRHPSQVYEGILEGLIPAIILGVLAFRFRLLSRPGLATGLFLIMYGLGRTLAENFRQPDAHIGFLPGGITMGMLLSLPMWLAGGWLIWNAMKSRPSTAAG
ncbi:MAG: prolipoprotein diacylglyceryl transferase [Pseudomonadota bacterium]